MTKPKILELIEALNQFDFPKFWILPNNDAGASFIRDAILNNRRSDYHVFDNLTRFDYLSLLKNCQFIIGNSSSGILEAPTYKTPAINLGVNKMIEFKRVMLLILRIKVRLSSQQLTKFLVKPFAVSLRLHKSLWRR